MDVVAHLHLKEREREIDRVNDCSEQYQMIGMGRSKWVKEGEGIGLFVRKERGLEVDEIDVTNSDMSEDILTLRI